MSKELNIFIHSLIEPMKALLDIGEILETLKYAEGVEYCIQFRKSREYRRYCTLPISSQW